VSGDALETRPFAHRENIIRKRLEIYRGTTEPVLDYHSDEIVHLVNPMEIKKRILERVIPAIRRFEQAG